MSYKDVDINFFYYPTTIAIVDDNASYLENIRLQLSSNWPTELFVDAKEALQTLKTRCSKYLNFLNETVSIAYKDMENDDSKGLNSRTIEFNLSGIYKKIYDDERFSNISTTIVDFDMPYMNGIEFCEMLGNHHKHIRKIMLTGKADNNIAVNAFNNGTIDKFILKGSDDAYDGLSIVLRHQAKKYFSDLSKSLREEFLIHTNSPMNNKYYADIFDKALKSSNYIEYYLLDLSGSFLFLDKDANPTFLLVSSEHDLNNYQTIATDSGAEGFVVDKLQKRTHLLYLLSDENYNCHPNEWEQFLYPCIESNDGTFYYAILNREISGINLSDVTSFHKYMQTLPL